VGANHGGSPEILEDGRTGILVEPGDARALATSLADLRGDPERRAELGAAAAQDVAARFSTERMLGETQAMYDRLLA
jgi:glycosyltransferase involved in cell wall biosynthesis